jgi:hypothetical protein
MKKILTLAVLGGLFAATTLQAQVNIYISGSTAFRANAWRSITNLYGTHLTGENPGGITANNSGATLVTLQGTIPTLFSAQIVTIYLSWNGSAQGTHNLVNNDNISFLTNDFAGDAAATNLVSHTPDLAFSDVFQLTTPFTTPTLVDTNVAVQPFCWVRGNGASTNIVNITAQQIEECWANGTIAQSYFTGKSSDDTTNVFFTGRNKDSGSRLTTVSDAFAVGDPTIWAVTNGVWFVMTTNTSANSVNYKAGFSSGGQEAACLSLAANGGGLGYLGYSDARTVVGAGGNIIAYNGALPFNYTNNVPLVGSAALLANSPDFTPIIKGQYSFWAYEHLFMRSGLSGNIPTFYAAIVPAIDSDIAVATPVTAIRLSLMQVSRQGDGGTISP